MVLPENEREIARGIYHVALGQVVRMGGSGASDLALAALVHPTAANIRALLDESIGRPWRPSIIDALAEIGVIAAADIFGESYE